MTTLLQTTDTVPPSGPIQPAGPAQPTDRMFILQGVTGTPVPTYATPNFFDSHSKSIGPDCYLSRCPEFQPNSDFGTDAVTPASCGDTSAKLQAVFDRLGAGTRVIFDRALKIGNQVRLDGKRITGYGGSYGTTGSTAPKTGVMQAPGAQFIFGSVPVSSYNGGTPATDWSLAGICQDVIIEDLFINGNRGNGGAGTVANGGADSRYPYVNGVQPPFPNTALTAIPPASPIILAGCRNIQIRGCYFYDPCSWAIYTIYADGFTVSNCFILDPVVYGGTTVLGRNTCLFQANGLCRNIALKGLAGWANDDFIAFNADDPGQFGVQARAIYGYPGAITSVQIEDLRPSMCYHVLRTLTGSNNVAAGSGAFASLIDQLTCRDVKGSFYGDRAYDGGQFYHIVGNHGDVELDNWQIAPTGGGGFAEIGNTFRSLKLGKLKTISGQPGVLFSDGSSAGQAAAIQSFRAFGIEVDDKVSTVSLNGLYLPSGSKMTIVDAVISASRFRRYSPATQNAAALVAVAGGTLSNLGLVDVTLDNWEAALIFTGGTMSSVNTTGLRHRNGTGGVGSIALATVTLPRLRSSGSDTVLLSSTVSGASITSKKTDGTEDA